MQICLNSYLPPAKTDYAVIIGVSTQDNLPLDSVGKAPENDATVMSDICRLHLGMKPSRVKLLTSHRKRPTRENIRKAVKDALKNTKREDMVLIYYSGHGHTVQDEHYLVPQDFRYYIYFIHELYAFIFLLGNARNDFGFKSSLYPIKTTKEPYTLQRS